MKKVKRKESPKFDEKVREIGQKARQRLEEEKSKRKEIVRLDDEAFQVHGAVKKASSTSAFSKSVAKNSSKIKSSLQKSSAKRRRLQTSTYSSETTSKIEDSWCPSCEGLNYFDLPKEQKSNFVRLHGLPEGTKVDLKILRKGTIINKTVTRGAIFVESVVAPYLIRKDIGYVKINSFSVNTSKEFRFAMTRLLEQGMKKIIIDLRNNGGGVLQCATDIADEFIEAGKLLLVTQGLHEARSEYRATSRGVLEDIDVAVLINSQSASASEILAGALQDNDKGTIIGRRSFGKGLVQEDRQLNDGSVLRLTIARYYTPTGRCIQREYNGDFHDYTTEALDRYENGEMYELDSSSFVNNEKFTTPGGKTLYGGGGIFPDIFVPLDSIGFTNYFNQLRYSDAFICFAFDFVENNRSRWASPVDYAKSFSVSDGILRQFLNYAAEHNAVPVDEKSIQTSRKLIAKILKAEIANQIWMEDGYYRVMNETDKEVGEALQVLK